jgi:hypothetical protein
VDELKKNLKLQYERQPRQNVEKHLTDAAATAKADTESPKKKLEMKNQQRQKVAKQPKEGSVNAELKLEVLQYEVGDEVIDQDGESCRIRDIDAEDAEKPYELEYPNGVTFWAAGSALSKTAAS